MIEYSEEQRRVFVLGVHLKQHDLDETLDSLSEIISMATTLDFLVVGHDYQTRDSIESKTFLGMGKLVEVQRIIQDEGVDLVLFDRELSPNQGKFLEGFFGCMVWDRTQLILEIFASHAKTPEAKDQVELAQLKYMLPRLVGMWAHLDREKGGIGASKGTGEKQINIDRTLVRKRISKLERSLTKVEMERSIQGKKRQDCFKVGVVGYTNAGKTTLMNQITGAGLLAQDKLFATLESTTRLMDQRIKPNILLSDTVGFIRNLPHGLVASFRSTLGVVRNADLLLHVVDCSNPNMDQHIQTTLEVLEEIGADQIPRLLVFNKADQVQDDMDLFIVKKAFPGSHCLSALDEPAVQDLRDAIQGFFTNCFVTKETLLPYRQSGLLARFYELGQVTSLDYQEEGIRIVLSTTQANEQILNAALSKANSLPL